MKPRQAKRELRFSRKRDEDGNGTTMLESMKDTILKKTVFLLFGNFRFVQNCWVIVLLNESRNLKSSKSRNFGLLGFFGERQLN